jgi:hypothetical protein
MFSPSTDDLNLLIRPGEIMMLRGAHESYELMMQRQSALAISALLKGRAVLIEHWLPDMHLICNAHEAVRGESASWSATTDWTSLYLRLQGWLDQYEHATALELSCEMGRCFAIPSSLHDGSFQYTYVLRCEWLLNWSC